MSLNKIAARRDLLSKVGVMAAGAAMAGNGKYAGQYPVPNLAYGHGHPGEPPLTQGAYDSDTTPMPRDPDWERRQLAERRIYEVAQKAQQRQNFREQAKRPENMDAYLTALKSPSPHWKAQIMQQRFLERQTMVDQWQEKIRKLREAPGHLIDTVLGNIMAEIGEL